MSYLFKEDFWNRTGQEQRYIIRTPEEIKALEIRIEKARQTRLRHQSERLAWRRAQEFRLFVRNTVRSFTKQTTFRACRFAFLLAQSELHVKIPHYKLRQKLREMTKSEIRKLVFNSLTPPTRETLRPLRGDCRIPKVRLVSKWNLNEEEFYPVQMRSERPPLMEWD